VKGAEHVLTLQTSAVTTEQNNVIINSDELIDTTEHLTLYMRFRTNRCRYNRVRLYSIKMGWVFTSSLVILDQHTTKTKRQKTFLGLTYFNDAVNIRTLHNIVVWSIRMAFT